MWGGRVPGAAVVMRRAFLGAAGFLAGLRCRVLEDAAVFLIRSSVWPAQLHVSSQMGHSISSTSSTERREVVGDRLSAPERPTSPLQTAARRMSWDSAGGNGCVVVPAGGVRRGGCVICIYDDDDG